MATHFHPLKIKDIRQETADCISVAFEIPPALEKDFRFRAGQNITLRTTLEGEELRRSYSLCSSPEEGELRVAIKKVSPGKFSGWAHQRLKIGDTLDVLPPTGNFFTPLDPGSKREYAAIAAGSGITPIISLIKTTLLTEPASSFTLVYGNRSRASIIFREELEGLKNKYLQRFRVIHILSREKTESPLNEGRIDTEKCREIFDRLVDPACCDTFYLCGPETMIFSVRDFLLARGVDLRQIHFELFNTPGQPAITGGGPLADASPEQFSGKTSQVTVKLDGIAFDLQLPYSGPAILDAALAKGADLPYACKGGVCSTCRARLLEGQVHMETNYALEPEELEAGYILTCQSHPRTEKVVVDFDFR